MKCYIIYFEWRNTAGNHAGMAYLAKQLCNNIDEIRIIRLMSFKNKYLRVTNFFYVILLAFYFKIFSNKNDTVFLMEYLAKSTFQDLLASLLKKLDFKGRILGLVHLSGSHQLEIYKKKDTIIKKIENLDNIIVFGSSLKDFYISLGFPSSRIIKTYHYVDTEYYKPIFKNANKRLEVICIGNIKRDYSTLRKTIQSSQSIHFHICMGTKDLSAIFKDLSNTTLHKYMSESELKHLMQNCDVGLSILEDTIGSNVITTSLACGLVQIISDVGSIRDYCTEQDSIFCISENDFIDALKILDTNSLLLNQMKQSAVENSQKFALKNFINSFEDIIIND